MIHVPVYLAVETDDPKIAEEVARAVADNSPQTQDVDWESSDVDTRGYACYSIRPAGRNAPKEITLLRAEPGQRLPATHVTVPGLDVGLEGGE